MPPRKKTEDLQFRFRKSEGQKRLNLVQWSERRTMPVSCFSPSASAPACERRVSAENGSCFGALLKACKRSRSVSWGAVCTVEFDTNPHFRKSSEDEFHKLYKVGKTLGVGGFSVVKKGKHIATGEDVAIKIIDRSKYDPNDGSLEREIVVLDKVHHPYCIGFKECFFTRKHVYLITELVTGGELLDRVLNHGKFAEKKACRIMKQLLEGVAYLHLQGIVHRDLKLENILLKSPDAGSPVKIVDFGLSKIFGGASTLTTICGSPQYVAPEVLEVGQKRLCYTPAADLWSLGVVMYILLSGYSPFDDANEAILFQKIKTGLYSMKQPVWETISFEGKDLMRRLLITIPEKRLTARQSLRHPWFKVMLDNPKEDLRAKQGISNGSNDIQANEVVSKKKDSREELFPQSEENLQTMEGKEGDIPAQQDRSIQSKVNTTMQLEMSEKLKDQTVLAQHETCENPEAIVQEQQET